MKQRPTRTRAERKEWRGRRTKTRQRRKEQSRAEQKKGTEEGTAEQSRRKEQSKAEEGTRAVQSRRNGAEQSQHRAEQNKGAEERSRKEGIRAEESGALKSQGKKDTSINCGLPKPQSTLQAQILTVCASVTAMVSNTGLQALLFLAQNSASASPSWHEPRFSRLGSACCFELWFDGPPCRSFDLGVGVHAGDFSGCHWQGNPRPSTTSGPRPGWFACADQILGDVLALADASEGQGEREEQVTWL